MSIVYQQIKNIKIEENGDIISGFINQLTCKAQYVSGGVIFSIPASVIEVPFQECGLSVALLNLGYSSTLVLSAFVESIVGQDIKIRVNKNVNGLCMECENDDVTVSCVINAVNNY